MNDDRCAGGVVNVIPDISSTVRTACTWKQVVVCCLCHRRFHAKFLTRFLLIVAKTTATAFFRVFFRANGLSLQKPENVNEQTLAVISQLLTSFSYLLYCWESVLCV